MYPHIALIGVTPDLLYARFPACIDLARQEQAIIPLRPQASLIFPARCAACPKAGNCPPALSEACGRAGASIQVAGSRTRCAGAASHPNAGLRPSSANAKE